MGTPISNSARGQLRQLWRSLRTDADLVIGVATSLPAPMVQAALRKGVGASKAMGRILDRMPPPIQCSPRQAVWRLLIPAGEDEPPSIAVQAILLGARNRPAICIEPFGLLVTRHALARIIDRSGGTVDPVAATIEAHNRLLALSPEDGEKLFQLQQLLLPAGPGVFLVSPRPRSGHEGPSAICKTWVSNDHLWDNQSRDVAAWRAWV